MLSMENLDEIVEYLFIHAKDFGASQVRMFLKWLETKDVCVLWDVLGRHLLRQDDLSREFELGETFLIVFGEVKQMANYPDKMSARLADILYWNSIKNLKTMFLPGKEEDVLLLLLDLGVIPLDSLPDRLPDVFDTSKLVNVFVRLDYAKKSAGALMLKAGYLTEEKLGVVAAWANGIKAYLSSLVHPLDLVALTLSYW